MARIGFKKAKYNLVDAETGKYTKVTSKVPDFEKVCEEKFEAEYNSAELYANDALAESDYSFKSGKLTLTIADDNDEFLGGLLGSTSTEGKEVTSNIDDTAPEFGYGHIIPKKVGGKLKYKVEFFPRVKCSSVKPGDAKSRGDGVEFATTEVECKVYVCDSALGKCKVGDWEKHQTFDTEAEAETYLDGLLTPEQ